MNREELKDIICKVIDRMKESENAPAAGCLFGDARDACESTLKYGI